MIDFATGPRHESVDVVFPAARLVLRPADLRVLNRYVDRINRAVGWVAFHGQVCSRRQKTMMCDFAEYLEGVNRFSRSESRMVTTTAAEVIKRARLTSDRRERGDPILVPGRRWKLEGSHLSLRVGESWLNCPADVPHGVAPLHGRMAVLTGVAGGYALEFPATTVETRKASPHPWIPLDPRGFGAQVITAMAGS